MLHHNKQHKWEAMCDLVLDVKTDKGCWNGHFVGFCQMILVGFPKCNNSGTTKTLTTSVYCIIIIRDGGGIDLEDRLLVSGSHSYRGSNMNTVQFIIIIFITHIQIHPWIDANVLGFNFSFLLTAVSGVLHFVNGHLLSTARMIQDDDEDDDEVCWCSGHESRWSQPEEGPAAGTTTLSHCHSFPVNDFPETLQPEATRRRWNTE